MDYDHASFADKRRQTLSFFDPFTRNMPHHPTKKIERPSLSLCQRPVVPFCNDIGNESTVTMIRRPLKMVLEGIKEAEMEE